MSDNIATEGFSHCDGPIVWRQVTMLPHTECFQFHLHNCIELLYITKGSLSFKCDTVSRIADAGDAVIFNYRQVHSGLALSEGVEYHSLTFNLSGLVNVNRDSILSLISGKAQFDNLIRDESLNSLIEQIVAECSNRDAVSDIMLSGQLNILIVQLMRRHLHNSADGNAINNRFEKVLSYINKHYTEDITTRKLADLVSYEESYFCRKFNQLTGMSLTNYVRMLRMEKARDALLAGNHDINSVAIKCGYNNLNYFTRCFKAFYGIAPTRLLAVINNIEKNN